MALALKLLCIAAAGALVLPPACRVPGIAPPSSYVPETTADLLPVLLPSFEIYGHLAVDPVVIFSGPPAAIDPGVCAIAWNLRGSVLSFVSQCLFSAYVVLPKNAEPKQRRRWQLNHSEKDTRGAMRCTCVFDDLRTTFSFPLCLVLHLTSISYPNPAPCV